MSDERARSQGSPPSDDDWFDVLGGRREADPSNLSERRAAGLRATYVKRKVEAASRGSESEHQRSKTAGRARWTRSGSWLNYAAAAAIGGLAVGIGLEFVEVQTQTETITIPGLPVEKSVTDPEDPRLILAVEVSVAEPLSEAQRLFALLISEGIPCALTYQGPKRTTLEFQQSAISEDGELALNGLGITLVKGQVKFIRIQFVRAEE